MALTLNGTTKWPNAKELRRPGETRMVGTPAKVRHILERVDEAMSQTTTEARSYIKQHPDFAEIGSCRSKPRMPTVRAVNMQNGTIGKPRERGDGTLGELVPAASPIIQEPLVILARPSTAAVAVPPRPVKEELSKLHKQDLLTLRLQLSPTP